MWKLETCSESVMVLHGHNIQEQEHCWLRGLKKYHPNQNWRTMPENDFEKSVQEKMDGFDLVPAPAVWNAVEKRIRNDKKRRFVFAWLLVALIAGGIGTTLLIISNKKQNIIAQQKTPPFPRSI